jgi:hypothetical protein
MDSTSIQGTIADGIIAAAPAVGGLFAVLFTPLAGAAVTGLLEAGGRLWRLGIDPAQALVSLADEHERRIKLLAAAKAEVDADEAKKFAPKAPDTLPSPPPSAVRIEPTNDGSDVYPSDPLADTKPE